MAPKGKNNTEELSDESGSEYLGSDSEASEASEDMELTESEGDDAIVSNLFIYI